MSKTQGKVLIIAGSDSGGGAGIQADLKSVMACGGYASTAVTSITAQNTLGVHGIWALPGEAVLRQIEAVLSDIGADAVKTGMLGSAGLVETVAETLSKHTKQTPRIIDPVMVASSGARLVDDKAVQAIQSELVPHAALVTPNAPEAEVLTGKGVETVDGQRRAAEALLEQGALGALVKGGHVEGDLITDVLQTHHGEWLFEAPRLETRSTHGTGCTLASAIASYVAQNLPMHEAVQRARDYVFESIRQAPDIGSGHGPLNHGWPLNQEVH